jgi:DNA polymerase III epsilon subunit-like protein
MAYVVDRVVVCDAFREPDKHYQLLSGGDLVKQLRDEVYGWCKVGYRVCGCRELRTLRLARHKLGISPTNLTFACERLGIPLNHHDPLSDAEAAARIMLTAKERTA